MRTGAGGPGSGPVDARSSRVPAALRVEGLTKRFGGVTAVSDVSFELAPGTALGVIGPNGAGKSTLLKLLARVYEPTSGCVRYGETVLTRVAAHDVARHGIGLAHQVPRPFRGLSVAENVAIGSAASRLPSRARDAWVGEVLERCGLQHRGATPAGELQLIDLKRLELARALSVDPTLILLDEVAAGLSGRELDEITELLAAIRGDGRGLILVEHVEGVVAALCERVVVIDWGKVIADAAPEQIAADDRVRAVYLGDSGPTEDTRSTGKPPGSEPAQVAAPVLATRRSAAPANAGTPAVLELAGVAGGYGDIVALRGADLTVAPGEAVGVFGANGAGKSTLVGVASGLLRARQGRVLLHGRDVTGRPAHVRHRLGLAHCPEGRHVFADLTVRENLDIAVPMGTRRADVHERLTAVYDIFQPLAEIAGRPARALSGGQQQMLAIGRALMSRPSLLLCDEVSLGLAPVAVDALYEGLVRIRGQGVAVLLVEQNVHRGLGLADRVYVLDRGQVSYSGDPAPLTDRDTLDRYYFGTSAVPVDRDRLTTPEGQSPT